MVMLAIGPRSPALRTVAGAILTLLPAVLMSTVIQGTASQPAQRSGLGDTTWRVTLSALRFALPDEPLSIGGNAQTDDLVVPGLPPKSSTTLQMGQGARPAVLLRDSVPGPRGGAIMLEEKPDSAGRGGPGEIEATFGGTLIPPGSEICLSDDGARCRPDSQRLTWVAQGDTGVLKDGSGATLCPLPPPASRRAGTSLTAKRIFPLSTYARSGCASTALFAWAEGEPAGELLYWEEGAPDWKEWLLFWRKPPLSLYLRPVDYTRVLIVKSGGHVSRIEHKPLTLSPGTEKGFSLYEILPAAALPTASRGDDNFARLQERRSFLLRYTETPGPPGAVLDVFLDTPQTVSVTGSRVPAISISSQSASPASFGSGVQVAGFSVIGKPTAAALLSTVRPGGGATGCNARNEPLIVQGVAGITCAQVGRWFALGEPGRVLAKVRIAQLAVPVAWIAAIWAICLINLLVRDALKVSVPVRIILALLELLLVLRVLVAFEAAAVDPRREDAVAGAWLALLWLPLAFELVPPAAGSWISSIVGRGAKGALVLVATLVIAEAGGLAPGSFGEWSTWAHGDVGKSALVSAVLCLPAWLLVWGQRLLVAVRPEKGWPELLQKYGPLATAAVPLVVVGLAHLLLVIAGVKEQIGGVRIAAALIPLYVLVWAYWYTTLSRVRESLSTLGELGALLAPFLTYISFILARDIGAFVYFIGLAAWLSFGAWPSRARHWVLWGAMGIVIGSALLAAMTLLGSPFRPLLVPASAALVVSLAVTLLFAPLRRVPGWRPQLASIPALAVVAILMAIQLGGYLLNRQVLEGSNSRQAVSWQDVRRIQNLSGNAIRLLDELAPQAVEDLGVRAAYEQRVAMAEMLEYGATASGRGWLGIPAPDALREQHVDDNVTAVHLLGPFGRLGGLGVGLLLITFAASIRALGATWPRAQASRGELAAMMLVTTSLYMLLANIQQVPFTGRNFYFLAVASHSDLLEGGLLLTIVLSAFAWPIPAEKPAGEKPSPENPPPQEGKHARAA
jgi:hypothetical protein